jgi:NADH-quinone oxidoreductase subunit C
MSELKTLQTQLSQRLPDVPLIWSEFRQQVRVDVPAAHLATVLAALKTQLGFDQLIDITAVDWLDYDGATSRFQVVYCLLAVESGARLVVRTSLDEPDLTLPSATAWWPAADWLEREVYDMFGITFAGHPDLRRLLMPTEFTAFPMRKDYPVKGRGERHNFPLVTRAES